MISRRGKVISVDDYGKDAVFATVVFDFIGNERKNKEFLGIGWRNLEIIEPAASTPTAPTDYKQLDLF